MTTTSTSTRQLTAPGLLAVGLATDADRPDLSRLSALVDAPVRVAELPGSAIATWRMTGPAEDGRGVVLTESPRAGDADLTPERVGELFTGAGSPLRRQVLPPFAAVSVGEAGAIDVVTDVLGFRQMYHREGRDWAAISSSAQALATIAPTRLDPTGVALQSLLGWQVGRSTPFADVATLPAGTVSTLDGAVTTTRSFTEPAGAVPEDRAPAMAAGALRQWMCDYLDDHPDAVLQLTGGQDSRLLLAAIPEHRRRDVTAMTLVVPGSDDARIAAELARRYGMPHFTIDMAGLDELTPDDASALALAAASRLDCSSDPLAFAALAVAEGNSDDRPRLSGLGGEVARGFYYFGRIRPIPVTRTRVARLASWRMFPNDSVAADALHPEFAEFARPAAVEAIFHAMSETGSPWFEATDEFYLMHRMRRWAGVLASAKCMERSVVNPMFDPGFLDVVRGVSPAGKRGGRLLGRILLELDPELAAVPMDGRPAPAVYASPDLRNRATMLMVTGRRIGGKVRQRVSRVHRPPVGGPLLATKIVEHWRSAPDELAAVRSGNVLSDDWLDGLIEGRHEAEPSTVSFIVTLLATGLAATV